MVNPVPGRTITTAYGIRGRHWSCNRNSAGHGIHTGADVAAPAGTRVVAARPGTARHVNFGSAFGSRQLLIVAAYGTADFYAHMRRRIPANGARVEAGAQVGEVGSEGNATGAHLHFERHRNANGWSCSNHVNPQPSIDWQPPAAPPAGTTVRLSHLQRGRQNSEDVRHLQRRLNAVQNSGLPITGNYLDQTHNEVRRHQRATGTNPTGTQGSDHVGPTQAEILFRGTGITVRDDR